MTDKHHAFDHTSEGDAFEPPVLKEIGAAEVVIRGFFGVGWDGPNGLTSPEFEFEADDELD